MKKQKKLLVIGIILAFVAVLSVSTASAVWIGNGTINNVSSKTTGSYSVNATFGTSNFTFTIDSSAENANAMLAIALTAASTGVNVHVDYATGGVLNRIWLVKP